MQSNFREQVSRFTMARNHSGGSYVLITALEDEDFVRAEIKGSADNIITGICTAIDMELNQIDDASAVIVREKLKRAIIKDEQRRFNVGADKEEQPCRTDLTSRVDIRDAPHS